jgi:hypothetical protein
VVMLGCYTGATDSIEALCECPLDYGGCAEPYKKLEVAIRHYRIKYHGSQLGRSALNGGHRVPIAQSILGAALSAAHGV